MPRSARCRLRRGGYRSVLSSEQVLPRCHEEAVEVSYATVCHPFITSKEAAHAALRGGDVMTTHSRRPKPKSEAGEQEQAPRARTHLVRLLGTRIIRSLALGAVSTFLQRSPAQLGRSTRTVTKCPRRQSTREGAPHRSPRGPRRGGPCPRAPPPATAPTGHSPCRNEARLLLPRPATPAPRPRPRPLRRSAPVDHPSRSRALLRERAGRRRCETTGRGQRGHHSSPIVQTPRL